MLARAQARIPKAERTRREILAAAEVCFADRGFSQTRLEDVGAEIGLAGSAILYHFRGKRELYHAVLGEIFSGLHAELEDALARTGTLPERIEAMVSAAVRCVAERPSAARIALREVATHDEAMRAELRDWAVPFIELLTRIFEEGERSGVLQPIRSDPFHFASAVAGSVLFYVAALPNLAPQLPYDHLAPEQVEALERDALAIARRLLGIGGPRPVRRNPERGESS